MRCFCSCLLTTITFLLSDSAAGAGLTLSIAAESADLSHLTVDQALRFDVSLSGLNPGAQLDYLAGTVTFDSSLLGSATDVTTGGIVPDPTGFVGAGFVGAADALYDAVFFSVTNTPISSNGVFYTFDVVTRQLTCGLWVATTLSRGGTVSRGRSLFVGTPTRPGPGPPLGGSARTNGGTTVDRGSFQSFREIRRIRRHRNKNRTDWCLQSN